MMPPGLYQVHGWVAHLFDVVGGLELVQVWLRLLARTAPLDAEERRAVAPCWGCWGCGMTRCAWRAGAGCGWRFALNGNRAFAIGHTLFLPEHEGWTCRCCCTNWCTRASMSGWGAGISGRRCLRSDGWGAAAMIMAGQRGWRGRWRRGGGMRSFNREAQAQIVQDYLRRLAAGKDVTVYEPFVAALRRGDV
jgi:hypothetical protein